MEKFIENLMKPKLKKIKTQISTKSLSLSVSGVNKLLYLYGEPKSLTYPSDLFIAGASFLSFCLRLFLEQVCFIYSLISSILWYIYFLSIKDRYLNTKPNSCFQKDCLLENIPPDLGFGVWMISI